MSLAQKLAIPLVSPLAQAISDAVGSSDSTTLFVAPLQNTLVASGLGDTTPTFTRATGATVVDYEGRVVEVLSGEARFQGARRVENVQPNSGTPLIGSFTFGTGLVTSPTTFETTGDGSAFIIYVGPTVDSRADKNRQFTVSATISCDTPGGSLGLLWSDDPSDVVPGAVTVNPATTPTRYTLIEGARFIGAGSGAVTSAILANAPAGAVFTITDLQFEWVEGQSDQAPAEYVSSGAAHGANVNGVKYFKTKRNGAGIDSNDFYADSKGPFGYLAEPALTNTILNSEQLGAATWSTVKASVPYTETVGWDGRTTGTVYLEDDGSAPSGPSAQFFAQSNQFAITAGINTVSFYAKAGTVGTVRLTVAALPTLVYTYYDLTGTPSATIQQGAISAGVIPLANGWVRCWATFDSEGDTSIYIRLGVLNEVLDGTKNLYIGGAQVDTGTNGYGLSSYVKTDSSVASRNADILSYPQVGNMNLVEGSVSTEIASSWETATNFWQYIVTVNAATGGSVLGGPSNAASSNRVKANAGGTSVNSGVGDNYYLSPTLAKCEYGVPAGLTVTLGSSSGSGAWAGTWASGTGLVYVGCVATETASQFNGSVRNVIISDLP